MPPKKQFSRQQIVDAAFAVASVEGLSGLTVRKVAQELGSSTAPIYFNFNSSEALHAAVLDKVGRVGAALGASYQSSDPFLAVGAASLCFAQTYPKLFWDVIHQQAMPAHVYDEGPGAQILETMAADAKLAALSEEERQLLLLKLRIFQMGLTTMAAQKMLPEDFDLEQQINLLAAVGEEFTAAAKKCGKAEPKKKNV